MMTTDDERYLRLQGYAEICERVRRYEQEIRMIDDQKIFVMREQIKGLMKQLARLNVREVIG